MLHRGVLFFELGLKSLLHNCPCFLVKCYLVLLLHVFDVLKFWWDEESKCVTFSRQSSSSTNSVNIFFNLGWWIVLNNPCHIFEIETSRSHIGTDKNWGFIFVKLKVVLLSWLVIKLTMEDWNLAFEQNLLSLLFLGWCQVYHSLFAFIHSSTDFIPVHLYHQLL